MAINEQDPRYKQFSKYFIDTEKLDFSDSLSETVRSAVIETIDEQLKSKHYQIDVSSATKKGDYNFTGIIYRVSFKREYECENGESTKPTSVILKVAPQNQSRRIQFNARAAFEREIYTYDRVSIIRIIEIKKFRFFFNSIDFSIRFYHHFESLNCPSVEH